MFPPLNGDSRTQIQDSKFKIQECISRRCQLGRLETFLNSEQPHGTVACGPPQGLVARDQSLPRSILVFCAKPVR
jgi:hypothetical protein